jgi:multisubunit Na+/H+ antiporter MnhF subunit
MAESLHPLAPHHIPFFLPGADGSDSLMTVMLVALIAGGVALGSFYLRLHSLPERVAHGNDRMQFEIVAILALLALFTHNNMFWVAALLLAFVRLPDLVTPLGSIAESLKSLAPQQRVVQGGGQAAKEVPPDVPPEHAPQTKTVGEDQPSVTETGAAEPARPDAQSPGRT